MRVLNFGSINIDYVYSVDEFVKSGETKAARSLSVFAGGKGLNQSLAMAKAGLRVIHAGKVGKEGEFLIDTLKNGGVDTKLVEISDVPTGHAIIQVDDRGRNCILLFGGANQDIGEAYIDRSLLDFGSGDIAYSSKRDILHIQHNCQGKDQRHDYCLQSIAIFEPCSKLSSRASGCLHHE